MTMLFEEQNALQVAGFIHAYAHAETLDFVQVGELPGQGYYRAPKAPIQEMHVKNLIVDTASRLMAKRMRPGTSWGSGITHLEVGSGVGAGTLQAPEKETLAQATLRTPMARKEITAWTYVDAAGEPTAKETNILQLATTFGAYEAVGPIVEMGLWGGSANEDLGTGLLFNYKTFPVWNKGEGMNLTIIWKLTF